MVQLGLLLVDCAWFVRLLLGHMVGCYKAFERAAPPHACMLKALVAEPSGALVHTMYVEIHAAA